MQPRTERPTPPAPRIDFYGDVPARVRALLLPALRRASRDGGPVERLILRNGRSEDEVVVAVCVAGRPQVPVYLSRVFELDETAIVRAITLVVTGMLAGIVASTLPI